MVACTYGSRVKASVTDDWIWVTGRMLATAAGALRPFITEAVIDALFPRLVELEAMCGSPPPPLPTIDLMQLALSGELPRLPERLVEWLLAAWKQSNWNTYCECIPTPPSYTPTWQVCCTLTGAVADAQHVYLMTCGPGPVNSRYRVTLTALDGPYPSDASVQISEFPFDPTQDNAHQPNTGNLLCNATVFALNTPTTCPDPVGVQMSIPYYASLIGNAGDIGVHYTFMVECMPLTAPPPDPYVPPALPSPPEYPPLPTPPTGCTTDDICAALDAIRTTLGALIESVTQIQRYELPFGYASGTVHMGLTAEGSFEVTRILGVRVHVAEYPSDMRFLPGNPDYAWNVGWLSVSTVDGLVAEKRLSQLDFVWLPDQMPVGATFSWALFQGVTINVVELLPAP
jgi:hypothetical protein